MASSFNLRKNYAPAPAPHEDETIDSPAVIESIIANFVWMLVFQFFKFLWTSLIAFIAKILHNVTSKTEKTAPDSPAQQNFHTFIDMTDADGNIDRPPF
uniref:Uncharacterized protein n=1 Tax=Panagrolaimus davidi TaxID=227884 RepID=A0A914PQ90_9BILA